MFAAKDKQFAPLSDGAMCRSALSTERLRELTFVTREVGDDYSIRSRIGARGEGSYISLESPGNSIVTFDELHLLGEKDEAHFIAGHEGAHAAQTPRQSEYPYPRAELEKIFTQLGFASTSNVIEDCAINDGMVRAYSGMKGPTTKVYSEQLKIEGGFLGLPEIVSWVQQHGEVPKFAKALSELLRSWSRFRVEHGFDRDFKECDPSNDFSKVEDPKVRECLQGIKRHYLGAVSETLLTGKEDKAERLSIGLQRFERIKESIFPRIKRLVDIDIEDQKLKEAAAKALAEKDGEEAGTEGNEAGGSNGAASDGISKETLNEIERNAEAGRKKAAEIGEEELRKALEELKAKLESASKEENAESKGAIEEKAKNDFEEKLSGIASGDKELEDKLKKAANKSLEDNSPLPSVKDEIEDSLKEREEAGKTRPKVTPDTLSEESKEELRKFFDSLSEKEKKELLERAKKILEKIEDGITIALRPNSDDQPQTHAERRDGEEKEAEAKKQRRDQEIQDRKFKELRLASRTPYEKIFYEVAERVDHAYGLLHPLFAPSENFDWHLGHPDGARLNVKEALQFEADPLRYTELFDKRLSPTKVDFAFGLLADCSGSMDQNKKIEHLKRATVFTAETLARLAVPRMITAYNDGHRDLLGFGARLEDRTIQSGIIEGLSATGGTNDADAIRHVYNQLKGRSEKHKFILICTDGESTVASELTKILDEIKKDGTIIVFHFGIGPGTTDTNGYFGANSKGDLPLRETAPGKRDSFFDVFSETMAEMILDPERFGRKG